MMSVIFQQLVVMGPNYVLFIRQFLFELPFIRKLDIVTNKVLFSLLFVFS